MTASTILSPEAVIELRAQCRQEALPLAVLAQQYGVPKDIITRALTGLPPYDDSLALSPREYRESRRRFNAEQAAALRRRFRTGEITVKDLAAENNIGPVMMRRILSCTDAYASDNDPVEKTLLVQVRSKAARERAAAHTGESNTSQPRLLTDSQVKKARELYRHNHQAVSGLARTFNVSDATMRSALTGAKGYASIPHPVTITTYHPTRKLSPEQAATLRAHHDAGTHSLVELAQKFAVTKNTVRAVVYYHGSYAVDAPKTNRL